MRVTRKNLYTISTIEELSILASEEKCALVVAKPWELLLDIDEPIDYWTYCQKYKAQLKMVKDLYYDLFTIESWRSRNGNLHIHLSVSLNGAYHSLDRRAAIFFQMALGSDTKRELLALWEYEVNPSYEDTRSLFRPLEFGI